MTQNFKMWQLYFILLINYALKGSGHTEGEDSQILGLGGGGNRFSAPPGICYGFIPHVAC